MFAKHAHETLREDRFERRGHQIGLDTHVHKPGDRARRVVRVQRGKNQMAGQRRLHGNLGGLLIANFADENHIGIVAQNRAQSARESQPGLFRDLNLIDAFELILDRVFNGDDFADRVIDLVERRVKSRGLAAAGGTGHQDDSVRQLEHAPETIQFACVQTQFAHSAQGRVLPQQTHHDRFTVQHRDYGHANVHFVVLQPDFDAPILRQPLFRDVEMAQYFYAGNNGGLKPFHLGGHRNFLQHAVNAITNAQFILERLQMNVRGAQLNGVLQHLVDEPYDRRVFGGAVQIRVFLVFVNDLKRRFFVQRVDRVRADAESFLHLAFDGLGGSENGLEPEARHGFERVQPLGREEAAGRDFGSAISPSQGKQLFLEQNAGGKQGK